MNPLDSTVSGDMSMVMSDSANMTHAPLFGGGMLAFQIALYVFFAYSQYTLSKKMNIQYSWMAWLPILGIFNLVKIAGLSSWWILGMFIPLWNIYAIIKIFHGISKNT